MNKYEHYKKLMTKGAYFPVNKHLAKQLQSNDAAILLQHFIDLQYLFKGREFFQQMDRLAEEINVSEYKIKECVKYLKEQGLITVEKKGMPSKNYYTINFDVLEELMSRPLTSELKTEPQVGDIQWDENEPTSELKTEPQVSSNTNHKWDENEPTSELKTEPHIQEYNIQDLKTRYDQQELINNNDPSTWEDQDTAPEKIESNKISSGEIKIINKLLQDLTQYSSVKLFEDALDEVIDSYGNRNEMYKVLGLDEYAIRNWERQINNSYLILSGDGFNQLAVNTEVEEIIA
jgi:biotin operon repressor